MLSRHGGNLVAASAESSIPIEQWIDLSTGISPWVWPVPSIPDAVWQRLPNEDNDLEIAAGIAYGCPEDSVFAVPGSQYAIQKIPALLSAEKGRCAAIPAIGYREHKSSWESAGHSILTYTSESELLEMLDRKLIQFAVVINPNNPTAEVIVPETLLLIASKLAAQDGFLIVDEAFTDTDPKFSVSQYCPTPGLIVLRSLGKFFGLAGIRLGFVLGDATFLASVKESLPLWTVTTVTRWVGTQALSDIDWQLMQRKRATVRSKEWRQAVAKQYPAMSLQVNPLFVTAVGQAEQCANIYQSLAKRGILVRLFDMGEGTNAVRFGLPSESELQEFDKRLSESPNVFA